MRCSRFGTQEVGDNLNMALMIKKKHAYRQAVLIPINYTHYQVQCNGGSSAISQNIARTPRMSTTSKIKRRKNLFSIVSLGMAGLQVGKYCGKNNVCIKQTTILFELKQAHPKVNYLTLHNISDGSHFVIKTFKLNFMIPSILNPTFFLHAQYQLVF